MFCHYTFLNQQVMSLIQSLELRSFLVYKRQTTAFLNVISCFIKMSRNYDEGVTPRGGLVCMFL